MGLLKKFNNQSLGRQLQEVFITSSIIICLILIIITKYQVGWLENKIQNSTREIFYNRIITQIQSFNKIEARYLSNEISNYIVIVNSNTRMSEIFHNFNSSYQQNPFNQTKPYFHTEAPVKTYEFGVYYSRNTISQPGWDLVYTESCFNYFYSYMWMKDFLRIYEGFKLDELNFFYPSVMRTRAYTPLNREWYYQVMNTSGRLTFTEPYVDFSTGAFVITMSKGIINNKNATFGVSALDITLEKLTSKTNKIKILKNGFALLISKKGMIVTIPSFWNSTDGSTVRIFDTKYTGMTKDKWDSILSSSFGSVHQFTDSRGVDLYVILEPITPFFDSENPAQFLMLCVQVDEIENQINDSQDSVKKIYIYLFWVILSIGVFTFIVISILIYLIIQSYKKRFKKIENYYRSVLKRTLFSDIAKGASYEGSGRNILSKLSIEKVEKMKNIEKKLRIDSETRPKDELIYKNWNECVYPFNYYLGKEMKWRESLDRFKRQF